MLKQLQQRLDAEAWEQKGDYKAFIEDIALSIIRESYEYAKENQDMESIYTSGGSGAVQYTNSVYLAEAIRSREEEVIDRILAISDYGSFIFRPELLKQAGNDDLVWHVVEKLFSLTEDGSLFFTTNKPEDYTWLVRLLLQKYNINAIFALARDKIIHNKDVALLTVLSEYGLSEATCRQIAADHNIDYSQENV